MLTLVTGATGLLGNNLVRLLLERGESVRVLARGGDDRPFDGLDIERIEGDIRDPSAVDRAVRGVSRVAHSAAMVQIGWRGLDEQRAVNVEGTRNVAQACLKHGARMVHVSSVDAVGLGERDHPSDELHAIEHSVRCPYVITKQEAEAAVREAVASGLDAVIVNPAFMLGPWDWKPSSGRMLLEIASLRTRYAPSGGNDFCDVRDVAAGVLAAFERGRTGERYILSGEGLSYMEAWTLFARIIGVRPPRRVARRWELAAGGRLGDLWGYMSGREAALNSAAAAISCLPHHFSSAKAHRELGYSSRPVEESARDAWAWFVEHDYRPYEPVRNALRKLRGTYKPPKSA